jgi:conjugal transfer ATP-binding protein TraC
VSMIAREMNATLLRARLSPYFVYESYDQESGFFFNRGSVGFVLIANPLAGTELTAENEIAEFIANSQYLPNGSSMQVLMIGSSDVSFLLNRWKNERKGEIYEELAKRRCDFIARKASEGKVRDSYLVISVTIPEIHPDLIAMRRRREALKSTLRSIKLWCDDVDDKCLLSILRKIWGRDSLLAVIANPYQSLSEQILSPDFAVYDEEEMALFTNNSAIIALEATERPYSWELGLMDLFLGSEAKRNESIGTDYLLHVGIRILKNQATARSKAFAKRETIAKNLKSGLSKFFPDLGQEGEDMDGVVTSLQGGARMIHIYTNMILKGNREKVIAEAANYSSMMRRYNWNFVNSSCHLSHMLGAMPMSLVEEETNLLGIKKIGGIGESLAKLGQGKQTVSSESKCLMPIIGEYKGDLTSPLMLLEGRRGQVKYFSQYGNEVAKHLGEGTISAENYNVNIAGVSGSGKSVLMQAMMLDVLGIGGKVFVLDYGKSFKNLCEVLEGNYIEFNPSRPISINPFTSIPTGNDRVSTEARADFLASFPITLATMAAPKEGTSDLQQTNLDRALKECWDARGNDLRIDDIADWLGKQENNNVANDLGRMLFKYTNKGAYGGFFSGKAEVSLNADIVVIETDHLRNYQDLLAVVMQIMMTHINATMAKGRMDRVNLLVFEEIMKTLENLLALKFTDATCRIVRKYMASVVLATQLLTDFEKLGEHGLSLLEGASFKLIMKQSSDSLMRMRSMPAFKSYVDTDERLRRMQTVESVSGEYSEFTLWSSGIRGDICRLRLDPFTLLLMSTKPADKEDIARKRDKGMKLTEAINAVLADRGVFR